MHSTDFKTGATRMYRLCDGPTQLLCAKTESVPTCSSSPHLYSEAEPHLPRQFTNCVSEPHVSTTPCYSLPGVGRASRTSQVRRRDACRRLVARMAPCWTMSDALQSCGRGAHGPRLKPRRLAPADGLTRSRGGPPSCAYAKTIRLAPYPNPMVALEMLRHFASNCLR